MKDHVLYQVVPVVTISVLCVQCVIFYQQMKVMDRQATLMENQERLMEQQVSLSAENLPDLRYEVSLFPKEFIPGDTELLLIKISNPLHYRVRYKVEIQGEGIIIEIGSSQGDSTFRSEIVEGLQTETVIFNLLAEDRYFDEKNIDSVEFYIKIYDLDKNVRLSWQKYTYTISNKGTPQNPNPIFVLSDITYY